MKNFLSSSVGLKKPHIFEVTCAPCWGISFFTRTSKHALKGGFTSYKLLCVWMKLFDCDRFSFTMFQQHHFVGYLRFRDVCVFLFFPSSICHFMSFCILRILAFRLWQVEADVSKIRQEMLFWFTDEVTGMGFNPRPWCLKNNIGKTAQMQASKRYPW